MTDIRCLTRRNGRPSKWTAAALVAFALAAPVAQASDRQPPPPEALPRVSVFASASSFYLLSRASIDADFRLLSFADDWVHVMAGAGIGAVSFFLGPPALDTHAAAGLLFFPGAHHLELRGGALAVSNSLAGDGPYLYPLFQVGYRYAHARSPLALRVLVGTTGAHVGVGLAF